MGAAAFPIKYVGSKEGILSKILPKIPPKIDTYGEPFMGAARVYFAIHERVRKAHLWDMNPALIAFWQAVRKDPDAVYRDVKQIARYYEKMDAAEQEKFFYRLRKRFNRDQTARPEHFVFLNRACFNGLYRVNRRGEFNVPFGKRATIALYPKGYYQKLAKALKRASIRLGDFRDFPYDRCDFTYFDPPYEDVFDLYTSGRFLEEDHMDLCETFLKIPPGSRLLSNSIHARHRYPGGRIIQVSHFVKGGRSPVEEILVQ